MKQNSRVCVVVPVKNRKPTTLRFIDNFTKSSYQNYTIVIVDDGSTDGTADYLKLNYPQVIVLHGNGNLWWSGATNEGVKYALENEFDYVLTINDDSVVEVDFLTKLVESAESHPNSLIAGRVMFPDKKTIWSMGVAIYYRASFIMHLNNYQHLYDEKIFPTRLIETQALAGNGVLIPLDVFRKIGLYDAKWCPQYHGDSEFSFRATRNGFKCYVDRDAVLYNNDFVSKPIFSIWDELFSKKSYHYWKPFFKFYWAHVPFKYKIFFLRQFTWIPVRILHIN
jgi:GT2 family glycosyltransferase